MKPAWILAFACTLLAAGTPPDPLAELDAAFRAAYAGAREEAVAGQGWVVVVNGDALQLHQDGRVAAEAVVRPGLYHALKAVAHVPLALRLLLRPVADRPLEAALVRELETFRTRLQAARDGLGEAFPAGEARARQGGVLDESLAFLDGTLARRQVAGAQLDAFSASMRGAFESNGREAAALELEALDRAMRAWRRDFPAMGREGFRVLIIGSHMAREGEVSWQFFSRLLDEPREGARIVYAEEKWELRAAMGLLATHRVDGDLGQAFFGEPGRMHRDVMADAAKKWLESHPLPR